MKHFKKWDNTPCTAAELIVDRTTAVYDSGELEHLRETSNILQAVLSVLVSQLYENQP